MLITDDGTRVHVIEFENLREFIKIQNNHYILKYETNDEEEAIYYSIIDTSCFMVLAFAVDKNFKSENIRIEGDKIVPTNDLTGNTITLAKVGMDTFLEETLDAYYEGQKRRCKPKNVKRT